MQQAGRLSRITVQPCGAMDKKSRRVVLPLSYALLLFSHNAKNQYI
jgi:hypothetical protein